MIPILTNLDMPDGPVLLLLGDSYSQPLVSLLIADFGKIIFYDVRSLKDSIYDCASEIGADAVLLMLGDIKPNRFVYLNP